MASGSFQVGAGVGGEELVEGDAVGAEDQGVGLWVGEAESRQAGGGARAAALEFSTIWLAAAVLPTCRAPTRT
jgi:hypothetical protein